MAVSGYIMVEGINIYSALFDTTQLSVIRGGSFLLAEAIAKLPRQDQFRQRLTALATGASSGLYEVVASHSAAGVAQEVADWLNDDPRYRHFTFAVAQVTTDKADRLPAVKAVLLASNRRQQLNQLSCAPDTIASPSNHIPCGLSGVRACREQGGVRFKVQGDSAVTLSDSVAARWRTGRRLRSEMYLSILQPDDAAPDDAAINNGDQTTDAAPCRAHLAALKQLSFVRDLETLGKNPRLRALNNKIAVIYLDGNGFGAIQRNSAKTPASQRAFDHHIRRCRADFLCQLLLALRNGHWNQHPLPDGWIRPESNDDDADTDPAVQALRLETLLWGGDEMTLVLPAWLGFDVLQMFYAVSSDWTFAQQKLTHAGGIVFCHAHSPIAEMRRLATQLADDVKAWMRDEHQRGNWFDYLVLESIDYPTEPTLADYRRLRYGDIAAHWRPIRADPAWFAEDGRDCRRLLSAGGFSRGQVFALARDIAHSPLPRPDPKALFPAELRPGPDRLPWATDAAQTQDSATGQPTALASLELRERRLADLARDSDPDSVAQLERLAGFLSIDQSELGAATRRAWLWLHLAELWDYLAPERDLADKPPSAAAENAEQRP